MMRSWAIRWVKPNGPALLSPPEKWNKLEVEVKGRTLRVQLNGKSLVELATAEGLLFTDKTVPGLNRQRGRIGLFKSSGISRFRNIEIKEFVADSFQEKSIWASAASEVEQLVLTVIERKGDTFKARLVGKDYCDRNVSGTIKDGKLVWLAKDVVAVKGNPGLDNYGTLAIDEKGVRIDFVHKAGDEVKGTFTVRLQAKN